MAIPSVDLAEFLSGDSERKKGILFSSLEGAARNLCHTYRFSIRFFLHPKSKMSLKCLESCIDNKHPKAYDDITAGEYLDERLREIGWKK